MNIRPAMVLLAFVSVLFAGCGSDAGTSPGQPSGSPAKAASPLEGTWRTEPITSSDAEATLRKHGLGKWIKKFKNESPIQSDTVLILDIRDEWDLYGESTGGPREEIDYDAEYKVDGDTVKKTHSTGTTTYRWSVDGDRLTIEWLSTTEPPANGIPDEVYQRALYMTADFTKDKS